jgi:citrate lyase subunit beta/citryl-CoA lyase
MHSFLFVPGDRPERFAKAAASGAHTIILDLEDAVAPQSRPHAREACAAWLAAGHQAMVRINGAGTSWHEADLALLSLPGIERARRILGQVQASVPEATPAG